MRRGLTAVVTALMLVTAGCFGVTAPGTPEDPGTSESPQTGDSPTTGEAPPTTDPSSTDEQPTPSPTPTAPPPDPSADRLGWEDGYWYNESVSVDRSDGLNQTELDAVVARAMARVEEIRRLEFERRVPVEIVSREQFAANQTGGETSTRNRLHQNTKWEAMFVVNESTNAFDTRESNRAASVGGFYSPAREEIVIVSENTTSPKMNEITLAQELFHALQDQRFDIVNQSWYPGTTVEEHNAADGVIEGDGNYVDHRYEQRCEAGWDCLLPTAAPGGGGDRDVNVGMLQVRFQPYSDGPALVQQLHESEGWEAVNDLYANPPASTEQVIHPEKYGEDAPEYPTVEDTSSAEWGPLEMGAGQVDYASFGEAGLATMMWYPSYVETDRTDSPQNVIVSYVDFFNFEEGSTNLRPIGPYNYDFPATEGWDGDRLVPYVTENSAATSETGYVWAINWDSGDDAAAFVDAYGQLLAYHGAEAVDDRENVYRIPEGNGFADAFHVRQDGDRVTIVNAPTVEDLGDVHAPAGA
jgi:hypothetical protein